MKHQKISFLALLCAMPLMACNESAAAKTVIVPAPTFFAAAKKASEVTAASTSFGYELTVDQVSLAVSNAVTANAMTITKTVEVSLSNVLAQGATTGFGEADTVRKASHVLQADMKQQFSVFTSGQSGVVSQGSTQSVDVGAYIEDKDIYLYSNHSFAYWSSAFEGDTSGQVATGPIYAKATITDDTPTFIFDTQEYGTFFDTLEAKITALTSSSSIDASDAWLASALSFTKTGDEYALNLSVTNENKGTLLQGVASELVEKGNIKVSTQELATFANAIDVRSFMFQLTLNEQGFGALSFDVDVAFRYAYDTSHEEVTVRNDLSVAAVLKGEAKFGYNVSPKDKPAGDYVALQEDSTPNE